MALQAGVAAFRDTLSPSQITRGIRDDLNRLYAERWAYYDNTIFADTALWESARAAAGLYRGTRPIYNPVARAVNLLVDCLYPGVLPVPGVPLPAGTPQALPLAPGTDPALLAALPQLWQWSGFAGHLDRIPREGAVLGDTLVELVDDLARGKVYFRSVWPGDVVELELDPQDNLKYYALAFSTYDAGGHPYRYRKEVTTTEIRTYRDEQPYGYDGQPPIYANWYGFVPARWFRHLDVGTVRGGPAWYGSLPKIPRMMALASHLHAYLHKLIEAPSVLWTEGSITAISGASKRDEGSDELTLDPETLLLLKGPPNGNRQSLMEPMDLGQALALLQDLVHEIEQDQPILRLYDELRAMSQVTGPAAERLVGDGANRVYKLQSRYDSGLVSLMQQALAVGGERIARGDWERDPVTGQRRPLTAQQRLFAPFSLASYSAGALNIGIQLRPLLPPTALEQALIATQRYNTLAAGVTAGLALETVMDREGWAPDEIAAALAARDAQQVRAEALVFTSAPGRLPGEAPNA